jgi:hypothetical protein
LVFIKYPLLVNLNSSVYDPFILIQESLTNSYCNKANKSDTDDTSLQFFNCSVRIKCMEDYTVVATTQITSGSDDIFTSF